MRLAGRAIRAVLLLWAATFAAVVLWQLLWPREASTPRPAQAIFCLGAGMSEADPARAGPASARRARTCAALHAAGAAPVVIFTGAGNDMRSAAEAMADVARQAGLPPEATLVETEARSTIQNADFGLALLPEAPGRVILVSDAFHLPRAWVIFRLMGVEEAGLQATPGDGDWQELLGWSLREAAAIWFNLGRLAAYGAGGVIGIDHETRIGWFD